MDIQKLKAYLNNRVPKPLDTKGRFAVMILIAKENEREEIIFELRAKSLKAQPGEISFPGGKVEYGETFEQAAIRETMEELLIERQNIEMIGEIDFLVSYANFTIHCFVAKLVGLSVKDIKPNKNEVDHIFTVPLSYLLKVEPDAYELKLVTKDNGDFPYELIPEGKRYNFRNGIHVVEFYKYEQYNIWGFTAKMTRHFIEIVKEAMRSDSCFD